MKLYRYTTNGEGVWSAGKRLLPDNLIDEAFEQRKWMQKPQLPNGEYRFFLTEKGKEQYEKTLLNVHKKYLPNIKCEEIELSDNDEIVFTDEWQVVVKKDIPQIIKDVGFDFNWSEEKVWALDVPVEEIPINLLTWHFDVPFLWENGVYNLKPQDVIDNPDAHKEEYERMMKADLIHPIDVMENKGRLLILDGLHRLMKASVLEMGKVKVRKVSRELIPKILK